MPSSPASPRQPAAETPVLNRPVVCTSHPLHPGSKCSCRKLHSGTNPSQDTFPIPSLPSADSSDRVQASPPTSLSPADDLTAHLAEELKATCLLLDPCITSAVPITGKHMSLLGPRPRLPPVPLSPSCPAFWGTLFTHTGLRGGAAGKPCHEKPTHSWSGPCSPQIEGKAPRSKRKQNQSKHCHYPSPEDLPNPGIKPRSPALQAVFF